MTKPLLESLRGGLIVSCQSYPGEPLRDARAMSLIAQSVVIPGVVGIRAQGLEDIRLIHETVTLPQVGLWKVGVSGVFITPTLAHALAVAAAGAEIVAVDGTMRARPDGLSLTDTIKAIHEQTSSLVMADADSLDSGLAAQDAGADLVGTTLAGYTTRSQESDGPDLKLVAALARRLTVPVFAEGRIHTPAQASAAVDAGAFAVVVGTAITHPATIASWFVEAVRR
jgi:N-acylglucosamine-6-phosphate 2-epimerase